MLSAALEKYITLLSNNLNETSTNIVLTPKDTHLANTIPFILIRD
ncbi:hypothetical protein JNE21005_13380 [Escherichia coli]